MAIGGSEREIDMKLISKPLTAALAIAGAAILLSPMALASTSRSAAAQQTAVTAPACAAGTLVYR